MPGQQRADARRNYARVLAVAEEEIAAHGANASMERIARIAGVGSGTVRRHFPTRRALLEAVSHKRIEALCTRAEELLDAPDSRAALLEWLTDVLTYCIGARGLAATLTQDLTDPVHDNACSAALEKSGNPLLHRAVQDGTVTTTATVAELIMLIVGIALTTETSPDPTTRATRLLDLTIAGLPPTQPQ
ncbi:TetR/AcrR family transcriptional regulator [Nocardia macrotermitis]|uniref:HTH tetR-type domain-containing protein n=1 Tax=Nocardia macrotermitis TaxID=2585198 RepID=A0A7K0CXB6_9NOCA|nr:helix-turn-helix domain-containing protein [Nocardia macrotermitis]MQY18061.1 hypothetical protein [Nocardia macrotermitis]